MDKLKSIIVDDEIASIDALKWELEVLNNQIDVIQEFQDPKAAIERLTNLKPDLIFLDIEMPGMNGFEFLKKANEVFTCDVIFTTAYDSFALNAFKVNAIDYLLKPIDPEELASAVQKVIDKRTEPITQQKLEQLFNLMKKQSTGLKSVALPTLKGLDFIEVHQVMYCQSDGNYTRLHLTDGETILVSKTLKEVEGYFEGHYFFRVHNSYLVNMNHIRKYIKGKGGYIVLKNGHYIPVSRGRKEGFLDHLE
jgi:two-component system LytT family response regulator